MIRLHTVVVLCGTRHFHHFYFPYEADYNSHFVKTSDTKKYEISGI